MTFADFLHIFQTTFVDFLTFFKRLLLISCTFSKRLLLIFSHFSNDFYWFLTHFQTTFVNVLKPQAMSYKIGYTWGFFNMPFHWPLTYSLATHMNFRGARGLTEIFYFYFKFQAFCSVEPSFAESLLSTQISDDR
jgi:hypothetical protein